MLVVMVIIALTLGGAAQAAHALLQGIHWSAVQTALVVPPPPAKPYAPSIPPGLAPAGLGATQSLDGMTFTLQAPTVPEAPWASNVAAPRGLRLLTLVVRLTNLAPDHAVMYTGYDFWINTGDHQLHHQDLAALAHPLGTGMLPPLGVVSGEIAFWIPQTTSANMLIYYLPQQRPGLALEWVAATATGP